jgi:hypothetical protein
MGKEASGHGKEEVDDSIPYGLPSQQVTPWLLVGASGRQDHLTLI